MSVHWGYLSACQCVYIGVSLGVSEQGNIRQCSSVNALVTNQLECKQKRKNNQVSHPVIHM